MRLCGLLFFLTLAACKVDGDLRHQYGKNMAHFDDVSVKLAFTCAHEVIPQPSREADVLFQYARWLQRNNQLKRDPVVNVEIERLYRISAEHNHYKANINLQNGAMRGHFKLRGWEHLRMSGELIDAKVATGYLFVAYFLEQGSAGLQQDSQMSLRYYRKAADEGSAQAQYFVGDKLDYVDVAPAVALDMYRCAAEQGHGKAAVALAVSLQHSGEFREALEVLQKGVAGGYEHAGGRLEDAFRGAEPTHKYDYYGQKEDLERAERYSKIWRILAGYSYANPEVPEINEIVPLPPAKLPPWDGKLQWLETRLANIPPEKPSEALIHKLAKEKVLDPATGKPMPGSPAFSKANFPVMVCASGQPCPQSGYWKVMINSWEDHIQHFEEGEIMPTYLMVWTEYRPWPLRDKIMQRQERVEWGLLG
ncbi:sel1 repeat family protein [Pseudomonas sp. NPDC089396]|uniref:SEL1-like repeat protein n=1 Tax=Pseudomonas sp. NPDC089396 TaxID=3364461 RepID=UPI003835BFAB